MLGYNLDALFLDAFSFNGAVERQKENILSYGSGLRSFLVILETITPAL
uniref:Uncharacterized protein n=1 Tax=Arundo donax TaxID=35708 RepID=A0A0A9A2F3_ARUDO